MIINAIALYSHGTLIATFSLNNPDFTQPYILKSAVGLDPGDISPLMYGQGTGGTKPNYYAMTPGPRQIALNIRLNPQYGSGQTPSSLRDALYAAISSYRTSDVQLRFNLNGTTKAVLNGFITKFESDLFTTTPMVTITVTSDYPFLRSLTRVAETGLSVSSPSVTDSISTAPHGLIAQVTFSSSASSWIMRRTDIEWTFTVVYPFISGDNLFFGSEGDNKYIYVTRAGNPTYLMDKMSAQSQWPLIFPGSNAWTTVGGTFTWAYFHHYSTFWGI